jgi:hypothetical protein
MQTVWTQKLKTDKEREEFKQVLKNSTLLTNRLLQILDEKFETIERRGFKEEDYAEAGWVTLQAFRNGKLAMLKEVADLFDFSDR